MQDFEGRLGTQIDLLSEIDFGEASTTKQADETIVA
jgi:hypothetical protein